MTYKIIVHMEQKTNGWKMVIDSATFPIGKLVETSCELTIVSVLLKTLSQIFSNLSTNNNLWIREFVYA